MGILNVTPDSFFEGSRMSSIDQALETAGLMLKDGATIIDIGAQSTRPGSELLSGEEELQRLIPVLEQLCRQFPQAIISVDTFYSSVAREAIAAGAAIINDISGGEMDAEMFVTVAELKSPYILTHMRGTPQTMQNFAVYDNIVLDVVKELSVKINKLHSLGVSDIIVDPGFGFSKTIEQNFELLKGLKQFGLLDKNILVGISRKSMIWKTLGTSAADALNGTTVLNMCALLNGATILRVHDVKEAVETVALFNVLQTTSK